MAQLPPRRIDTVDATDVARMTIVYGDGSMDIFIRQPNGTFSIERRNKK
jgi:hypothetical protein|tara:strand:+ start:9616 stop:9762 length:147 start_codon:yes stop_codon:yes gene_type:complete